MMKVRLSVLIGVGIGALFSACDCLASQRATAEGTLKRYALPLEPSTLLRYLSEGIPEDHQPSGEEPRLAEKFPFQRWGLYQWIATYLGEVKYLDASPVLLDMIMDDIPPMLQLDLDVHVAGYGGNPTWDDWDTAERGEIAEFRAACAEALARIGHKPSLPKLTTYLRTLEEQIPAKLSNSNADSALLSAFSHTCRAITALGDKKGIDALIRTLNISPRAQSGIVIYYLRICTGQTFGPEYDHPLHLRPAEIAKWKGWWDTNRTNFVIDERKVIRLISPDFPRIIPRTLREYVASAESRTYDYDGTGYGRQSAQWLEVNGKNYQSELLRLLNDSDEPSRIRGEAMAWYAKFAGRSAFPTLREYATDDTRYSTNTESIHLQSEALKLIEKYFPVRVDRVAKDCLGSKHSVAEGAVYILSKDPENHAYLVEMFYSLTLYAQHQAIQNFKNFEQAVAQDIFFKALTMDDQIFVQSAMLGIEKFNLISLLPDDVREAFEKLQDDPEVLIGLSGRDGRKLPLKVYDEALRRIPSTNADSARRYRSLLSSLQSMRAGRRVPEEERDTLDMLIDDAGDGFQRCVDSYRRSRGRD